MNRLLIILALLILTSSCSNTKEVFFTTHNNKGQRFKYSLQLPRGFKMTKLGFENEIFVSYKYPDSSIIFFSDDTKATSPFPKDAYEKYGKDLNILFLSKDTITISGWNNLNKYWKTRKGYNVVYGYNQVPLNKLNQYDSILKTFKER